VVPPVRQAPPPKPSRSSPARTSATSSSSQPSSIGQGPVLGSTPTTQAAPAGTVTYGLAAPAATNVVTPAMPPGGLIGSAPADGSRGLIPKSALPRSGIIGNTPPAFKSLGLRTTPSGGVIGGAPGASAARPGTARPVSKVSPPGGLIGQQSGDAKPERGASYGQPIRPGRRHDEGEANQRWDPDNPWETEEGVAPVMLPAQEPGPHYPGPALGQGRCG
jgi:hypothetical protein